MLEEPPLLHIAKRAHRVLTDAEMAPFRNTLTGMICDALGGDGALEHIIKPVTPSTPAVVGQALTMDCGPADILGFKAGITQLRDGDVMIVATGGWTRCASVGDLTCGMAKNTGAGGIVTDGMVRDVDGIRGVGIPVYARGITPNSPHTKGPASVGFPVDVGGMRVETGDLIIGDSEGVVIVPLARVDEVTSVLAQVKAAEAKAEARIAGGGGVGQEMIDMVNGPKTKRDV